MNKIKALREKYRVPKCRGGTKAMSQRQLGVLMGYSRHQIYRLEAGIRQMTPHFEILLESIEKSLKNGDAKIPK